MKVYDRGYSTPRTVNFGNEDITFVCDPHYMGQYLVPSENETQSADITMWPFSPDNDKKKYFLQYVIVQKVEEWRKNRGTYFAMRYGDKDAEEHEYIGSLFCLTGDDEDLAKLEKKMEQAGNGDFNEDGIVGYCDLLLYDNDGNVLKYKEVYEKKSI